jgi:hypothetical protein
VHSFRPSCYSYRPFKRDPERVFTEEIYAWLESGRVGFFFDPTRAHPYGRIPVFKRIFKTFSWRIFLVHILVEILATRFDLLTWLILTWFTYLEIGILATPSSTYLDLTSFDILATLPNPVIVSWNTMTGWVRFFRPEKVPVKINPGWNKKYRSK